MSVRARGGPVLDFPLLDLLDEQACYDFLVDLLHPGGLAGPGCGRPRSYAVRRAHREPVLDSRCWHCGRVCNARTGTALPGTQRLVA